MAKLTFLLGQRQQVAEATMSFRLELAGQSFAFQPGQFMRVGLSDPPYPDPKGNVRSFSIASAPAEPFYEAGRTTATWHRFSSRVF